MRGIKDGFNEHDTTVRVAGAVVSRAGGVGFIARGIVGRVTVGIAG